MSSKFISVIIPCYNEGENLKKGVLKSVYEYLQKQRYTWEVIISDDGSTDDSQEIVQRLIKNYKNFRLIINPHGGKPSALFYGINKSQGKYILFTDMDQSTPISELDKLIPFTESGFRVVIGSRGYNRKDFPLIRRLGSVVFTSFRKFLILPEITDTQCGFKLFSKDVVKKAFPHLQFFKVKKITRGWKVTSYDVELLHLIKKMGYKIKEVEVSWSSTDTSTTKGGFLGRYIKESREMLMQIIRVKTNDLRGMYRNL